MAQHILSAVESEIAITGKDVKGDPTERDISVSLDERDLWVRFQCFTNEMIVTKSGRYVDKCSASQPSLTASPLQANVPRRKSNSRRPGPESDVHRFIGVRADRPASMEVRERRMGPGW